MSLERDFRNSELGSEAHLNILLSSNTSPSLLMKSLDVWGEAHSQSWIFFTRISVTWTLISDGQFVGGGDSRNLSRGRVVRAGIIGPFQ